MADLYFHYSVMNAGKTTQLLQVNHNYIDHGGRPLLFTSARDTREGVGKITARIGLSADAYPLRDDENLFNLVEAEHLKEPVTAVLLDEVNFMTATHVEQASDIVDYLNIPVMAYGLKNNVFGHLFGPSVERLLALANKIIEMKQICHCGRKATMILRFGAHGAVDRSGDVVQPGGEQQYVSVCRYHYKQGDIGEKARKMLGDRGDKYQVHCSHCGNGYQAFAHDQGNDCASYIQGNEVTGAYGSAITDMSVFRFAGGRPAHISNGIVCDPCVQKFIDEKLLYEVKQ